MIDRVRDAITGLDRRLLSLFGGVKHVAVDVATPRFVSGGQYGRCQTTERVDAQPAHARDADPPLQRSTPRAAGDVLRALPMSVRRATLEALGIKERARNADETSR